VINNTDGEAEKKGKSICILRHCRIPTGQRGLCRWKQKKKEKIKDFSEIQKYLLTMYNDQGKRFPHVCFTYPQELKKQSLKSHRPMSVPLSQFDSVTGNLAGNG
jgi:hypothetical protein